MGVQASDGLKIIYFLAFIVKFTLFLENWTKVYLTRFWVSFILRAKACVNI